MTDRARLVEELSALAVAATAGPWEARDGTLRHRHWLIDAPGRRFVAQIDGPPDEEGEANAALIVALRNNLPAILALSPAADEWQDIAERVREEAARVAESQAEIVGALPHSSIHSALRVAAYAIRSIDVGKLFLGGGGQ